MTELNQNPMNTDQRSKAPLVLFIVCILVLAIVGGYFAYAKSLDKTADVGQLNKISNVEDNAAITADTTEEPSTNTATQVPVDWKEYTLTDCEIIIQIPSNWQLKEESIFSDNDTANNIYSLTSTELTSSIEKSRQESSAVYEGMMNDFIINCYGSLDQLTKKWWDLNKKNNPNFSDPKDLFDALTRKNTVGAIYSSVDPYPIMQVIDIQQVEIGGKEAFAGYVFGTPGTILNYYFQNESTGKIISFESEENEYPKITLKQPHSNIIKNFQWIN